MGLKEATMERVFWNYPDGTSIELFHGGCHGCTQQLIQGVRFCAGCMYYAADWSKPNYNNEHVAVRLADIRRIVKEEITETRGKS